MAATLRPLSLRTVDLAFTTLIVPTNFEEAADWGENVRDEIGGGEDGLEVILTGDLGFSVDAEEVFSDFDAKLLIASAVLVLFLLGAIYRAVLVALTPLVVVFFAYSVATAFVYLYANSGATVSSNGTSILIVLLFGITTDYCLLLVSRYKEELHRIEDKHDAMQRAVSRTGPTILASGMTVSLAMLTLTLADAQITATLGPVAAISVFCGMLAGLTLLPALLAIFGRKGFWPRSGTVEYDPRHGDRHPPGRLAPTSVTRCSSARVSRSRPPRSSSSSARSGSSPTASTTRPRTSSRRTSTRSKASS